MIPTYVGVCVYVRERERERERDGDQGTISLCYTINPCLSVLDIVVSLNHTLLISPHLLW